jgi:glycerol-3-phosphate dehydrogenase (NAD+)
MSEKHSICMIGSGNMGSAMAKIIGENVKNLPEFDPKIRMYTYPEKLEDGSNIVDSINEFHMNKKYLPGVPLPENVVAIDNVPESCEGCDYIVIVTPHQFLPSLLKQMVGKIKKDATAISLVKGVTLKGDTISLVTDTVEEMLGIPCGALMGANIANDVAKGEFCESTIAFKDIEIGNLWKPIFNQPNFRIKVIQDLVLQQLCGTLKNIYATGVGFLDGLGLGESTKAAFIRIGMEETYSFANWYFPDKGCSVETLLESCGVADFICTSYGGRNRKVAEAFVKTGKSFEELEKEMLNGQKLQGVLAAKEVAALLKERDNVEAYPLLVTVHMIATKQVPPETILDYDGSHVANMKV